jgi:hypothetical protein
MSTLFTIFGALQALTIKTNLNTFLNLALIA